MPSIRTCAHSRESGHRERMQSSHSTRRRRSAFMFLLLSLLVLGTRVSGVHWHLCPDGLEQHETLHWAEPGLADELEHAQASLRDCDLCIAVDAIADPSPARLLALLQTEVSVYQRLIATRRTYAIASDPVVVIGRIDRLLPQPRGPPPAFSRR